MAAAVATGLAKIRSHPEKNRFGGDSQGPSFVSFGEEREERFGLRASLGQVAQVVQEQEVEVVQLPQLTQQGRVRLAARNSCNKRRAGAKRTDCPASTKRPPVGSILSGPGWTNANVWKCRSTLSSSCWNERRGGHWEPAPAPYLDWKRSTELHPHLEDPPRPPGQTDIASEARRVPRNPEPGEQPMKDCPEAPEPQFHTPRDPEATREPSAILRYGETDRYIRLFVLFTTTGVIAMIVHQVIAPIGSPLDTIRYIILNVGDIAGMGIIYTIAVALVSKTARSVYRRLRRLPFRSREGKPC